MTKCKNIDSFEVGEYIVYVNGDRYEIGRVKSLRKDGAFVCYHEGETAAKTSYDCMHKLVNGYCIKESILGGDSMMRIIDSMISKSKGECYELLSRSKGSY